MLTRDELEQELRGFGYAPLCEDIVGYAFARMRHMDGLEIGSDDWWDMSTWLFEYFYGVIDESKVDWDEVERIFVEGNKKQDDINEELIL